jgi:hypothetical protein
MSLATNRGVDDYFAPLRASSVALLTEQPVKPPGFSLCGCKGWRGCSQSQFLDRTPVLVVC